MWSAWPSGRTTLADAADAADAAEVASIDPINVAIPAARYLLPPPRIRLRPDCPLPI
jgi:hypothetical protein